MSIQQKSEKLKKKIQMQNMIILALAIVIIVLIVVSSTAAWYIRTKSDSADIVLANPVNIYITEYDTSIGANGDTIYTHHEKTDILENYQNKIYPGDKIKMNLGMRIGSEREASSPAYVRVKLSIKFSRITSEPNQTDLELEDLPDDFGGVTYKDEPNPTTWKLVDFNDPDSPFDTENSLGVDPDYWYVYTVYSNGEHAARQAQNLEEIVFLDGYIALDKESITNEHANCKFHIIYEVEAMQIANVADPILYPGMGPWWGNNDEPNM